MGGGFGEINGGGELLLMGVGPGKRRRGTLSSTFRFSAATAHQQANLWTVSSLHSTDRLLTIQSTH